MAFQSINNMVIYSDSPVSDPILMHELEALVN